MKTRSLTRVQLGQKVQSTFPVKSCKDSNFVLVVDVTMDDDTDDEEYYTAKSFFCDGSTVRGQATELRRLKELDAKAPAVIPQDASMYCFLHSYCLTSARLVSALTLEPPFCTQLPSEMKVAGRWKKDSNLSTPIPNAVEDILNSSMFVQSVKKRINDFEVRPRNLDLCFLFLFIDSGNS